MNTTTGLPLTPSRLAPKIATLPGLAPTKKGRPRAPQKEDAKWDSAAFFSGRRDGTAPQYEYEDYTFAENFRHSGWAENRKRVAAAMNNLDSVSERRIAAFKSCGCDAYIEASISKLTSEPTEFRTRCTKCHDRFCVPCAKEKSYRVQNNLLRWLKDKRDLSLITLTLKQSEDALKKTVVRITKHFRKLRSLPIWKKNVKGGVAIIETKIGTDGKSWNVHMHVIAEARYLRMDELQAAWLKCTKDSHIVDVRRVGSINGAAKYVTKYITKAADQSIVRSPYHLKEAIEAFTGCRLISTFGTWRGLKLSEVPEDEKQEPSQWSDWRVVGTIASIMRRAAAGEPIAVAAARHLTKRGYCGEG